MTKNLTKKPRVIAVVGPTASGKTEYAVNLAKEVGGEIISADSRLVYKGFNIACAKPDISEQQGIPHYMMDMVEPETTYSAGLYAKEAKECIYKIISRGKTPIIAGGTGLYFRLLLENYELPKVKPDYEYRKQLQEKDAGELYELLKSLDEAGAETIEQNDKKKLIRAIEIVKLGGKPLSELRGVKQESEFDVEWIGLNFPRKDLYERINKRVELMVQKGILEETKILLKEHGRIPNITETIGYREIIGYLDGQLSLDEAISLLKQNTRRYAKRQLTWFRKNEQIKWNYYPETLDK